ncbi:hypothetical protein NUW54_g13766 [Trametes sanguinea]|uniref:Uncharacterized protein n=1 Tax=Trametes sanguinea TaxID=158606 RepID=A0ACC1MHT7_9APHY|nr:hypothetical protein NUW54_g13766 [Trametes sanguinea]
MSHFFPPASLPSVPSRPYLARRESKPRDAARLVLKSPHAWAEATIRADVGEPGPGSFGGRWRELRGAKERRERRRRPFESASQISQFFLIRCHF